MSVSLDKNLLICGTSEGSVGVYKILYRIPEIQDLFIEIGSVITAVALTSDNSHVIFASQEKLFSARINNQKNKLYEFPNVTHDWKVFPELSYSIGVVKNTSFIIFSTGDKSIKILDVNNKKTPLVHHFKDIHRRAIKDIAVSSNGNFFASCSDDRCIKVFDVETKELVRWFEMVHTDPFSAITFSKNSKFLITGSSNQSIKVFDLQTQQEIHYFRQVHNNDTSIKHIVTTPDNRCIVPVFSDNSIKFLKLVPTSPPFLAPPNQAKKKQKIFNQEIYYVYHGVLNYSNFNEVDHFLFYPQMPIKYVHEMACRWTNLTVYPYRWNILHIVAIKYHDAFLKNMPEYATFKVPFLLDTFSKTPLHYLIAYDKVDLRYVNTMLNYICDYLEALSQDQDQRYQAHEIILSMVPLFWYLLIKPDTNTRARFFGLCSIAVPMPYKEEPPTFGEMKMNVQEFCSSPTSIQKFVEDIREPKSKPASEPKTEEQITFRVNIFKLNYDVLSPDMNRTIKCLSQQVSEDIFKTELIIDLIDHLWEQVKATLIFKFVFFSCFLIFLSYYLSREDGGKGYEIAIICWSGFFIFGELLQAVNLKKDYLKDYWNFVDITLHPLILGYMIALLSGLENELKKEWLSSIILLLGYLRWISNLRTFQQTRSLIQVILTVVQEMWSFLVIIAAIIIGFSFIFLVLSRGRLYGFYLYNSYSSLYGPVSNEESSPSELVWIALIAFLLNVILLNLLISIMGDSRTKVLEKRMKTDSLTRLDIISEAIPILRCYRSVYDFKPIFKIRKSERLQRFVSSLSSLPSSLFHTCFDWIFSVKRKLSRILMKNCPCLRSKKKSEKKPEEVPNKGFLARCQSSSSTYDEGDEEEGSVRIFRKLLKQTKDSTENKIQKLQQDFSKILDKRKIHEKHIEEKMTALEKRLKTQFENKLDKTREDQDEKTGKMLDLLTNIDKKLPKQPKRRNSI